MRQHLAVCILVLLVRMGQIAQAQTGDGSEFDFQTYKIFKVMNTLSRDNSECNCTRDEKEVSHTWQPWSICQGHQKSFECHKGIQYRARVCSENQSPETCTQREWKYCYNAETCTGQWQSWTYAVDGGKCSHTCGGGIRIKVRACEKDSAVGLYCAGKNRSPYDIAREACNTFECPKWSNWKLLMSNCSEMKRANESVTYERTCTFGGKRSSRCEGGKRQRTTRPCTDAPLSFHTIKVEAEKQTDDSDGAGLAPNALTYILGAVAGILAIMVAFLAYHYFKSKRQPAEYDLEYEKPGQSQIPPDLLDGGMEKSHSFIGSSSTQTPSAEPKHQRKSKWSTPENYEQIDPDNEPIHAAIIPPNLRKTSTTNFGVPLAPPPLHRSFTDLNSARIEPPPDRAEYTIMSGSPTTHSAPPINGHKVLPVITPRKAPKLPIPRRKPNDDYLPPPPGATEFTEFPGTASGKRRSGSMGAYNYGIDPSIEDTFQSDSRPTTLGRKEKKKTDQRKKRHRSEVSRGNKVDKRDHRNKEKRSQAVSRGDSVGFSKLHGGALQLKNDDSGQSHLYAEIHDNTRF